MDEVVRGGPSSSTTSPPTKARPTTRTMPTTSSRTAMSSNDLMEDETSAIIPVTEKGPNKGLSKGKGRWWSIQEERYGPMYRRWIPFSESAMYRRWIPFSESGDSGNDEEEMPSTPPATTSSMGEREPGAEPPRKTQPWREMVQKGDGWCSVVYDPDSVLDPEGPNIEQIIQSLPVPRVVPPPEPRTRMEAAQMVITVPRPDGYHTDEDGCTFSPSQRSP